VGDPNVANRFNLQTRESDMLVVVFDDRKGKSGRSEGALL